MCRVEKAGIIFITGVCFMLNVKMLQKCPESVRASGESQSFEIFHT